MATPEKIERDFDTLMSAIYMSHVARVFACLERAQVCVAHRLPSGRWEVAATMGRSQRVVTGATLQDALAQAAQWIEFEATGEQPS